MKVTVTWVPWVGRATGSGYAMVTRCGPEQNVQTERARIREQYEYEHMTSILKDLAEVRASIDMKDAKASVTFGHLTTAQTALEKAIRVMKDEMLTQCTKLKHSSPSGQMTLIERAKILQQWQAKRGVTSTIRSSQSKSL